MLHCYLHAYLMGYHMCGYNCVYFYGYCLYILHVYVYCYFSMNPCNYICICVFTFFYIKLLQELCVYILIACSSKKLCGIAQLDVGYVTVCSAKRIVRVLWRGVARHGWSGTLQHGIRALFFNVELG
jgi:hypothetical protein